MFDKLSKRSVICLGVSLSIMGAFFVIQTMIVFGFLKSGYEYDLFGILLTNSFSIIGTIMGVKYATDDKSSKKDE